MDHQWGSIGPSISKKQQAIDYAAYAAGVNINPVNMGFGVPGPLARFKTNRFVSLHRGSGRPAHKLHAPLLAGTENWFGIHLVNRDGSHRGSYCGILVDYRMWNKRPTAGSLSAKVGATVGSLAEFPLRVGQWQLPNGTQHAVNYSYIITSNLTTKDGSAYATGFHFRKEEATDGYGMPEAFDVLSVATDSRVRWAAGGFLYEGAVEVWQTLNGSQQLIGHCWTEAVGWDR